MELSKLKKFFVVATIAVMMIVTSSSLALGSDARRDLMGADAADPAVMAFDFAAARPVGLLSLATGAAFFIASLPFSILGGNTGEAFDKLVIDPARYTFLRPLGGF
jgi:hypothetical protein